MFSEKVTGECKMNKSVFSRLTLSKPELSAFQAMTGIPRYPASWSRYWDEAVERPYLGIMDAGEEQFYK